LESLLPYFFLDLPLVLLAMNTIMALFEFTMDTFSEIVSRFGLDVTHGLMSSFEVGCIASVYSMSPQRSASGFGLLNAILMKGLLPNQSF
jgi:hypothetical protein